MLSSLTLASISSAFHPIVAYPGKQTVGLNWSIEKNEVFNFYTQVLSTEQAQQFIKQHSIEYILDGPDAPGWTQPRPSPYPFLEKIWEVDTFVLYKVIL